MSLAELIPMKRGVDYIGVGVGAIIINADQQLFLSLRGPKAQNQRGKWEFPGGSVEFNETLEQTIVREIDEEYGIKIAVVELLDVVDDILPEEKQHWVAPTFICKHLSGIPTIREVEKCSEIGWFSISNAEKLPLSFISQQNLRNLKLKYPKKLPSIY